MKIFLVTTFLVIIFSCSSCTEIYNSLNNEQTTNESEEVILSLFHNASGIPAKAIEDAIKEFCSQTNIKVEIQAPGNRYEEIIEAKMASNSMPDLWTTHGWSTTRYKEYLRKLNDQPFAQNIVDSIKSSILDSQGNLYVLPINVDIAGIIYNADVLNKCNIDVNSIKLWSDFEQACEAIKSFGYIPIYFGGEDSWMLGQYFDYTAPSFYTLNDSKNYRQELLNGTFEWQNWFAVCDMLDRWNKSGYINSDCLTSNYTMAVKMLAENKTAFIFSGNSIVSDSLELNSEIEIGMMPIPTNSVDDEPILLSGESTAFGVWNESKYIDEALILLNYLARDDVCSKLASANYLPIGLKNVKSDMGIMTQYYEKYKDTKTIAYFDRQYLPSGMWNDLSNVAALILSGKENSINESIEQMQQSFKQKY